MYARAISDGDLELALLASVVIGEVAPQRLRTAEKITATDLSDSVVDDGRSGRELALRSGKLEALLEAARSAPDRRFRCEAIVGLNTVRWLGNAEERAQAFALLPVDSRAAFPSLHTAASLAALVYAWRYVRWWAWVLVPFVLGLWASTIYLRHHYFVDLVAGWLLAPAAVWVAPRVDAWWARQQRALGYEPARGASPDPREARVALGK